MISAKVIQDSICHEKRIITLECEYPRFIHAEVLTHRSFSRNSASSRAIPIERVIEQVSSNTASPVFWGTNKAGMQAGEEHEDISLCLKTWNECRDSAIESAAKLNKLGLHKQLVNRMLEPFHMIKTVVTATEWENFFTLRDHEDAQPEIRALAIAMREAIELSAPEVLKPDEWHVPYVNRHRSPHTGNLEYRLPSDSSSLSIDDALRVSASCCAQVSYRRSDDTLSKADAIYNKLITMKPAHASPVEHAATPLFMSCDTSGNFVGWKQNRQVLGL